MKVEDNSRIKINPMEFKGYVFDEPFVLQQIAKGFQRAYPNLKLVYPILNTNPESMFNYALMGYHIQNPNMWFTTVAVRFTNISTHAYVYLKQFGNLLIDDYIADIGDATQFMSVSQFMTFLQGIQHNTYIDPSKYTGRQRVEEFRRMNPMAPGGQEIYYYITGLSMNQEEPNYFLGNSENINVLFENLSNLKITVDNAKKAKQ